MDLFSHGLLGFVLGQALRLDPGAQIILVISSVILDIDAIRTRRSAWFQFHRGPLHSFLGATLVSLAISTAYAVLVRLPAEGFISIVLICIGGSFSHIFLDLLTPRSMAVLWPFSNRKIAFDLTHFVDPIVLGVLLLASISIVSVKNDVQLIQIAALVTAVLLTANFGVRYYGRTSAIETVKRLNLDTNPKVAPLPTLRPDTWWVAVKTPSENGYSYEIYSVASLDKKILSKRTVKSPFVNYRGQAEPPVDSLQEAVACSKRDKQVNAFIEKSRLPAVKVTLSDDGSTWQVFWYDIFTHLSEGVFRGVTVRVNID